MTRNIDKVDLLLGFLSSVNENLKSTVDLGDFLDLQITIDDKKLLTLIYSKPTDSHFI